MSNRPNYHAANSISSSANLRRVGRAFLNPPSAARKPQEFGGAVWTPRPTAHCLLTSAATISFALSAQAHPGHDLAEVDTHHLLTSPDHLAALALAGAALWFGARFVHARLPRRLLQGAGLAAVAVAAVVWGLRA
jgi:hypothetical protein